MNYLKSNARKQLTDDIKLKKEIVPLLEGKYNVLYADPPWEYREKLTKGYGAIDYHYPTMTIKELCQMNVKDITANNAVLFLWTISPFLPECLTVIKAWGFKYRSLVVWDKMLDSSEHYFCMQSELLLICIRGAFLPESKGIHVGLVSIKRTGRHPEKPEYFRELIEKMYPHGKWIELFARYDKKKREKLEEKGWTLWGAEV